MIYLEIRCSHCGKKGLGSVFQPAGELRSALKEKGWVRKGKNDYCPKCLRSMRDKPCVAKFDKEDKEKWCINTG